MREEKRPLAAAVPVCVLLLIAASCSLKRENRSAAHETGQAGELSAASVTSDYYARPDTPFVANPFCRACHLDFDEEELALDHEIGGIGCERCHGESLRHRSDEANVTPPELMYPKERINPACMMCHPRQDIEYVKEHQPILEAAVSIFETAPLDEHAAKFCTDCHGLGHRMKVRSVRWDKCTGELIH
jgi:hypothetical protein